MIVRSAQNSITVSIRTFVTLNQDIQIKFQIKEGFIFGEFFLKFLDTTRKRIIIPIFALQDALQTIMTIITTLNHPFEQVCHIPNSGAGHIASLTKVCQFKLSFLTCLEFPGIFENKKKFDDMSTPSHIAAICHSLIQFADHQLEEILKPYGVASILDAVRLACKHDHHFRDEFLSEFDVPLTVDINRPLTQLESLLLKDENMISLSIYQRIQQTIIRVSKTEGCPILSPLHDVIDLQLYWNEKVSAIMNFESIQEETGYCGWKCALDKLMELAISLATKYSKLYGQTVKIHTGDTLRYVAFHFFSHFFA